MNSGNSGIFDLNKWKSNPRGSVCGVSKNHFQLYQTRSNFLCSWKNRQLRKFKIKLKNWSRRRKGRLKSKSVIFSNFNDNYPHLEKLSNFAWYFQTLDFSTGNSSTSGLAISDFQLIDFQAFKKFQEFSLYRLETQKNTKFTLVLRSWITVWPIYNIIILYIIYSIMSGWYIFNNSNASLIELILELSIKNRSNRFNPD